MKFRVERDVLSEAVAWVARALPARPVVPVLSGMLVQADRDQVTLSCFDYEVSACAVVSADVGEPGAALVPGRLLAEISKSLPPADTQVVTTPDMMMLTCGSAEFALVCLPRADYPELPELPAVAGTVDGALLATAAAQVVPSASRDDTLPMLTGVCIDFGASELALAATDRYRLAVRTIPWQPADPGRRASALVPARTLADVARTTAGGGPVTIALGQQDADGNRPADGMISFEGGGRRLTARLIGSEFIRYDSRFPAAFDTAAEVAADALLEAVRRVSLVAERTTPVQLTFRPGAVTIEARSDGRARAIESVPADFAGDDETISFNPQYLLDGLAAAALTGQSRAASNSDSEPARRGKIRLEFTGPAKPAVITWRSDEEPGSSDAQSVAGEADGGQAAFRYLVVPLRVPVSAG